MASPLAGGVSPKLQAGPSPLFPLVFALLLEVSRKAPPDDRKRLAIKACFSASQLSKRLRPDRKRGAAPQAQRSLAALYDAKLLLNPGFAQ